MNGVGCVDGGHSRRSFLSRSMQGAVGRAACLSGTAGGWDWAAGKKVGALDGKDGVLESTEDLS